MFACACCCAGLRSVAVANSSVLRPYLDTYGHWVKRSHEKTSVHTKDSECTAVHFTCSKRATWLWSVVTRVRNSANIAGAHVLCTLSATCSGKLLKNMWWWHIQPGSISSIHTCQPARNYRMHTAIICTSAMVQFYDFLAEAKKKVINLLFSSGDRQEFCPVKNSIAVTFSC